MTLPDFKDLDYRKEEVLLSDIFPRLDLDQVKEHFSHLKDKDPHKTVFNVSLELWNGGYDWILYNFGFHEERYSKFSRHCHQCTPALGLVLKSLGFEKVSYLECYRINGEKFEKGTIEKVDPDEEPNPEMKDEFCSIGRIPYCCLEMEIEGEMFYLTGKHIRPSPSGATALLKPVCYRSFTGFFHHQEAAWKSGIYLQPVKPKENPENIDFDDRIVWLKQTSKDPQPEHFCTFLKMSLLEHSKA